MLLQDVDDLLFRVVFSLHIQTSQGQSNGKSPNSNGYLEGGKVNLPKHPAELSFARIQNAPPSHRVKQSQKLEPSWQAFVESIENDRYFVQLISTSCLTDQAD